MCDAHTELANMIHSNHSPTKAASVPLIQRLKHITCPAHYTALTVNSKLPRTGVSSGRDGQSFPVYEAEMKQKRLFKRLVHPKLKMFLPLGHPRCR